MDTKKKLSQEDLDSFVADTGEVVADVTSIVTKIILEKGISTERIAYGLFRVAATLAVFTDCKEETYLDLARIAFDEAQIILDTADLTTFPHNIKKSDLN